MKKCQEVVVVYLDEDEGCCPTDHLAFHYPEPVQHQCCHHEKKHVAHVKKYQVQYEKKPSCGCKHH